MYILNTPTEPAELQSTYAKETYVICERDLCCTQITLMSYVQICCICFIYVFCILNTYTEVEEVRILVCQTDLCRHL